MVRHGKCYLRIISLTRISRTYYVCFLTLNPIFQLQESLFVEFNEKRSPILSPAEFQAIFGALKPTEFSNRYVLILQMASLNISVQSVAQMVCHKSMSTESNPRLSLFLLENHPKLVPILIGSLLKYDRLDQDATVGFQSDIDTKYKRFNCLSGLEAIQQLQMVVRNSTETNPTDRKINSRALKLVLFDKQFREIEPLEHYQSREALFQTYISEDTSDNPILFGTTAALLIARFNGVLLKPLLCRLLRHAFCSGKSTAHTTQNDADRHAMYVSTIGFATVMLKCKNVMSSKESQGIFRETLLTFDYLLNDAVSIGYTGDIRLMTVVKNNVWLRPS